MLKQTIADPTFGLNSQALAVLAVLSQMEPHFAPYNHEGDYGAVSSIGMGSRGE